MRLSRFAVLFCILSMNIKIVKADPLDIKVVPYLSQLQRNLLAKDFEAAGNNKDKYTLAVSPSGVWQSFYSDSMLADERKRNVLERCEHITKMRCLVVYLNGKMTGDRAPHSSVMTYPNTFDPIQIPFVSNKLRRLIRNKYHELLPNKAIAFNSTGGFGVAYGRSSPDAAR